ncbi:MAG: MazG nucleotide pyrophosphohydrolase domain-containing protein [Bacillota bacterium]
MNLTQKTIKLPRLGLLTPTMDSTLLKIMEESGELARAVLLFEASEENAAFGQTGPQLITVAEELLDVAQTCVTMIFVLEDTYGIDPGEMVEGHLEKLKEKGYLFNRQLRYYIETNGYYKYLKLPRLDIPQVTLLKTVCKIQEEIGELTQILGKKAGRSGEKLCRSLDEKTLLKESALELLDIAQCCFTMLYILENKYNLPIDGILAKHLEKLKAKGYY